LERNLNGGSDPLSFEGRGREFESRRVRHCIQYCLGFLPGASARLNILLNTERIVEKSSRPQPVAWGSREDRLAYARGPMAGSAFVFVKQASKRSGLSRLPQVKCPLWLP
jgi:hypothetical protein